MSRKTLPISCYDTCPVCGADLKYQGWPTQHQHDATGAQCEYEWNYEDALAAEVEAEWGSEADCMF